MKLYHYTKPSNVANIMKHGLKGNSSGIIYLTPHPDKWHPDGEVCLEVETGDLKLTAFEDCEDWEVLCWTDKPIPPDMIIPLAGNPSRIVAEALKGAAGK